MPNTCPTTPLKIIYKVTSPSGKIYIGKTERGLERRKAHHLYIAKLGSKLLFSNAVRKYGELLKWEIIDTANTSEELALLEISWIKYYSSYGSGYNLTIGGDGAGKYNTREEAEKARKSSFKKYSQTEKYKKIKRDYSQTEESKKRRKDYFAKYNKSPKRKEYFSKYYRTQEYRDKKNASRRKIK
jgi:hypothetical protein